MNETDWHFISAPKMKRNFFCTPNETSTARVEKANGSSSKKNVIINKVLWMRLLSSVKARTFVLASFSFDEQRYMYMNNMNERML